jgi:hypothetical protein
MRWYHVVLAGLFGAAVGGALAGFVLFACTATVGTPAARGALAIGFGTMLVGVVGGVSVGVALAVGGRSGKPPTV